MRVDLFEIQWDKTSKRVRFSKVENSNAPIPQCCFGVTDRKRALWSFGYFCCNILPLSAPTSDLLLILKKWNVTKQELCWLINECPTSLKVRSALESLLYEEA